MVAKQVIVAVFLLGASWAQSDGGNDRPQLPPDMADKCTRNGGEEAYLNVERAIKKFKTYFKNLADWDKLDQDIKEAMSLNRGINEVVKKSIAPICTRKSQVFGIIMEMIESFKPCYKADEHAQGNVIIVREVVDQLLKFICQDDGDVLISFAACYKHPNTRGVLEGCLNGLQNIMPLSNNNIHNAVEIDFDDSTCKTLYEFQKCVVQELKTCSQEVGNSAQSLVQGVRLSTPCKNKPNSASGLTVTILSSVMAAWCLLLM